MARTTTSRMAASSIAQAERAGPGRPYVGRRSRSRRPRRRRRPTPRGRRRSKAVARGREVGLRGRRSTGRAVVTRSGAGRSARRPRSRSARSPELSASASAVASAKPSSPSNAVAQGAGRRQAGRRGGRLDRRSRWSSTRRSLVEQRGRVVERQARIASRIGCGSVPVAGLADDLRRSASRAAAARVEQRQVLVAGDPRPPQVVVVGCRSRPRAGRAGRASRAGRRRVSGPVAARAGRRRLVRADPVGRVRPDAPQPVRRRPVRRSPGEGEASRHRRSPRSRAVSRPIGPQALSGMRAALSVGGQLVAGRLDLERRRPPRARSTRRTPRSPSDRRGACR